jgi:hypothetical protein
MISRPFDVLVVWCEGDGPENCSTCKVQATDSRAAISMALRDQQIPADAEIVRIEL